MEKIDLDAKGFHVKTRYENETKLEYEERILRMQLTDIGETIEDGVGGAIGAAYLPGLIFTVLFAILCAVPTPLATFLKLPRSCSMVPVNGGILDPLFLEAFPLL